MNKLNVAGLLGSLILLSAPVFADVSANVSIGTDYVYRGISQTNENATIQGGFDYVAESGFYAGIWGSNVAFDGSVEVDFYAGYGGAFNETVSYDVGVLRYEYQDDGQDGNADSSFNEVYASISFVGVTLGLNYSPDFFFESDAATYVYANYDLDVSDNVALSFHIGDQSIDDNDQFGLPDYIDYSIGVSTSVSDVDLSLTWFDTDLSSSECGDICDSRIVFAIGKSL